MAGKRIFEKRNQLRAFSQPTQGPLSPSEEIDNPIKAFDATEMPNNCGLVTTCTTEQIPRSPSPNRAPTVRPSPYRNISSKGHISLSSYSTKLGTTQRSTIRNTRRRETLPQSHRVAMEANTAAWAYTKVALLFFISLLITWVRIPSIPPRFHISSST